MSQELASGVSIFLKKKGSKEELVSGSVPKNRKKNFSVMFFISSIFCVVSPVSKTADSILGSPSMNGGVEKPFVAVTKMEPLDSRLFPGKIFLLGEDLRESLFQLSFSFKQVERAS